MTDTIQVGLWGCGNMGSSLADALVATGEARLSVVYDLLPTAAAALHERYGPYAARSLEELLTFRGLDGVIIALPPYLHLDAALQAAAAGVHVFVEKPMALHAADCQQMIQAARQNDIKLMVGQVLRYYEPYRSILRWKARGLFGKIYAASIWRVTDGARWAVDGYWRASKEKSGGYLFEVGAHELDMLRCLLGAPQTVYASLQKAVPWAHEMEDYVAIQIRFQQGGAATYEAGGGARTGRYGFRLYFEGATLISEAAFDPQALQIYGEDGPSLDALKTEFSTHPPVQAELLDGLAALRGDATVPIPGEEGMATVALAEVAYRSASTAEIVPYHIP
jgi:predicted dehydrogenase